MSVKIVAIAPKIANAIFIRKKKIVQSEIYFDFKYPTKLYKNNQSILQNYSYNTI